MLELHCGLGHCVYCVLCHFALGCSVGLLVWLGAYRTLINSSHGGLEPDPRIWRYSLWLAISLAIVAHVLEDYYWGVF